MIQMTNMKSADCPIASKLVPIARDLRDGGGFLPSWLQLARVRASGPPWGRSLPL